MSNKVVCSIQSVLATETLARVNNCMTCIDSLWYSRITSEISTYPNFNTSEIKSSVYTSKSIAVQTLSYRHK